MTKVQIVLPTHQTDPGTTTRAVCDAMNDLDKDNKELISVVCSKDDTHQQLASTVSKVKYTVAKAFEQVLRVTASKYIC